MSPKLLKLVVLSIALAAAVFITYARPTSNSPNAQSSSQESSSSVDIPESGSLSRQPEAVKLSRRVRGGQFDAKKARSLLLNGVVTNGTGQRNVQIRRNQNATGEQVEVWLAGANGTLSWDAAGGAHNSAGALDVSDRILLERLTFDSADEFILAQLRGASYYVVARNVRRDDVPDNYSGPLWDVVRIDEPEQDEQLQLLSRWRLYYLNSVTGLIDKIVYDSQGSRIEANLADWTERNGEKFPSTITWTSQGQTLQVFKLTSASSIAR